MPIIDFNAFIKFSADVPFNGGAPGANDPADIGSVSLPYASSTTAIDRAALPWSITAGQSDSARAAWAESSPSSGMVALLWSIVRDFSAADRLAWGASDNFADAEKLPWIDVPTHESTTITPWGESQHFAALCRLIWGYAPSHAITAGLPWGASAPQSDSIRLFWQNLAQQGAFVALPWGGSGNYRSGYDIPYGQDITGDPTHTHTIPDLLMYIMLPSFSVMSGGDNLDATSFTIGYNEGDTSYTFNATINRLKFPLVKVTTESGPIPITITANGFSWALQVEAYRDNMVFKQQSYTISGRGISAQLGPGIAPAKTYTEGSSKNISQLVDQELASTDWTAVYAAQDGLIPANKWTYSNLTPLEAIAELASKTGSVVVPDPISQTLTIRPGFPKSPWAWPAATPFAIIPAAFIASLSGQWSGSAATNGVYVTGQNGGVRVLIKRTGSDGAKQMQQVTDPLIVTAAIATERGRAELSKATKVKSETIVVPLLPSPVTSDNPGPLLPGALLQFHEPNSHAMDGSMITGATLLGKSVSWSLSGTRQGAAITIRQTVGIDLHNMATSL